MSKFKDLTGQRFGKLMVVSRADDYIKPNGNKIVQWRCVCDCGNEVVVRGEYLKSGHTKSYRIIEYNGESHTLEEWSRITGIASSTIRMRLDEYKWDVEKSLTKSTTKEEK